MFSAVSPSKEGVPFPAQHSPSNCDSATTHQMAKLLLRRAGTLLQRYEAVSTAESLGMPLGEIEAYLDGLDFASEQSRN